MEKFLAAIRNMFNAVRHSKRCVTSEAAVLIRRGEAAGGLCYKPE